MSLASARLGVRLARRETRRHPWRSALVLLMVLVPTMAMTLAATAFRTAEWSGDGRRLAEYGQADYVARPTVAPTAIGEGRLAARLPAGTFLVSHSSGDRARSDEGAAYITVSDLDLDDPIVEGRFGDLDGRLAEEPGEAVLTPSLAEDLHVGLGDDVRLSDGDETVEVVGIVERMLDDERILYVTPETFDAVQLGPDGRSAAFAIQRSDVLAPPPAVENWQIDAVPDLLAFSHSDDLFWVYVGGAVGLFVVGTVIAAAFAVGARRQLRTIGLLSSTGASPRTVRWFLVTQGIVGGALGSLLGVATAMVVARLIPDDLVDKFFDRPITGPVTRLGDVVGIVLLGMVAGAGAAWFPARSASQVSTLQALAGRRPLPQVPRHLPVVGLLCVVGGTGLLALAVTSSRNAGGGTAAALVAIAGGVIVLVGTLAISPWAVAGLERVTSRISPSARLAGRSLARSRVRSSAVVGAICAVTAMLVVGGTLYRSQVDESGYDSLPGLSDHHVLVQAEAIGNGGPDEDVEPVVDDVLDALGGGTVIELRQAAVHREGGPPLRALVPTADDTSRVYVQYDTMSAPLDEADIAVADPALLDALQVPDRLRDALDDGQAIAIVRVADDPDSIGLIQRPTAQPVDLPFGGSFASPVASYSLPWVLVPERLVADLGFVVRPSTNVLVDVGQALTDRQRRRVDLVADDMSFETRALDLEAYIEVGDESDIVTPLEVRLGVYAFVMLAVGLVVAIGLGLAAKDAEDERQVLSAVGASPRTLRRVGALRASLLVATASVIAVPTGIFCAWVINLAIGSDIYEPATPRGFRLDVPTLAFLLAVPVVVALIGLGWNGVRDLLRPTRPESLAFGD